MSHIQISVPNRLAKESYVAGVLEEINSDFINQLRNRSFEPKPLLVCGGGTTTRCAANGYWTLDLRKKYKKIKINPHTNQVDVEGGITMGTLVKKLAAYDLSFPIGLSMNTGLGYILNGGISPISRSQGLAIDNVLKFKGIWGNGEDFEVSVPNKFSTIEEKQIWRALCGAAPFLAIITGLSLQAQPIKELLLFEALLEEDELIKIIQKAEEWPDSMSLQWFWKDKIKVYIFISKNIDEAQIELSILKDCFPDLTFKDIKKMAGLHQMPIFSVPYEKESSESRIHCEVISLLGTPWGSVCPQLIKSLSVLIENRPDPNCYIASQQLGGRSTKIPKGKTSFIHRQSIWKPWITASWDAKNHQSRKKSLEWLETVWELFEPVCPGVHMAQMHPHLSWHQKEITSAFQEWLPGLKNLKSHFDPQGILPPL